jgi:nucleotide-binding universal stress UspA family protein
MPDRVIKRVLAPVELSESELPDMQYAVHVAQQLGAELILFAVIDTPAMVQMIGQHKAVEGRSESFNASLVADAKTILQPYVDRAAAIGVEAIGHATVGEDVVAGILKEALVQKVDMILVRATERHGIMQALMGDMAGEILKAAPCPVLVARS